MHTEHLRAIKIHHELADVNVVPRSIINASKIKQLVYRALDDYAANETVPAAVVHQELKERHGKYYLTAGYHLKIFRFRADLTQVQLAELVGIRQHHLSEMEHNKRPIGKKLAKQIAKILDIDYRTLL